MIFFFSGLDFIPLVSSFTIRKHQKHDFLLLKFEDKAFILDHSCDKTFSFNYYSDEQINAAFYKAMKYSHQIFSMVDVLYYLKKESSEHSSYCCAPTHLSGK